MIDDSGHPYYHPKDEGPFTLGAVVTDNPESVAQIALTKPADTKHNHKKKPGTAELKHSNSKTSVSKEVMNDLNKGSEIYLFATKQNIDPYGDYDIQNSGAIFAGTLSRLLIGIGEHGPDGIYRIRLDQNDYISEELLDTVSRAAFSGIEGKQLADRNPVKLVESDLAPSLQTADMFVGEFRHSLKGNDESFVQSNNVYLCNRKPKMTMIQKIARRFGR